MQEKLLNGNWELHDAPLAAGPEYFDSPGEIQDGWIEQPVPGDIHQGLVLAGRIKDPLIGLNSFECRWTEDRSWWFRRRFSTGPEWLEYDAVELELNGLDANAQVFLNGAHLGGHRSAFHPFVVDVRQHLVAQGVNTLLVRLSAGVENITDEQLATLGVAVSTEAANGRPERGDPRRAFVRKPQYGFGWDWSPRVATTAIAGDVKLTAWNVARIRDVFLRPERMVRGVNLHVQVAVDSWHYYSTGSGRVTVNVIDEDQRLASVQKEVLLRSGVNTVEFSIRLDNPRYWWPNGLGEQHLYTVKATLDSSSSRTPDSPMEYSVYPEIKYGLRFVELDHGDIGAGDRRFTLVVNGKRIFCKGADWIPTDTVYAQAATHKYNQLIHEAQQANFNMLRVWGGGLYEPDIFYEACDREGILLWHDFMFACAPYPDAEDWFREEVRKEAEYQTGRLRNHACMGLWSGSNENNWGFDEWWHEKTHAGAYLYNYLLPSIVERNSPGIPYWNGSPYGGATPNASDTGDRHHWSDCMMNPAMEKRITPEEYDKCNSLFVSEYGYIGAPDRQTVVAYLDGAPLQRQSQVWQHHNNTFEKQTVEAGIRKHYADPEKITLDEYFLYSGLTQGLMYGYSLDSFRANSRCSGELFWMYADCWGEVGWTILDYYLRRKVAWYFVKRAYAPLRLIMRQSDEVVHVVMANDTQSRVTGTLEYGRISLDGRTSDLRDKPFTCPPLQRREIASFKRGEDDPTQNLWIARAPKMAHLLPAMLRSADTRNLKMIPPRLRVSLSRSGQQTSDVQVGSNVYAHAVHLLLPSGAVPTDDYFDLLPGEQRVVKVSYPGKLVRKDVSVTSVVCQSQRCTS